MSSSFPHFCRSSLSAMAALVLVCGTNLQGQETLHRAKVDALKPPGASLASVATPATQPENTDGNSDPWTLLFSTAPGLSTGVSPQRHFRMARTPSLFGDGETGFGLGVSPSLGLDGVDNRVAFRRIGRNFGPGKIQMPNMSAAARGNMMIPIDSSKFILRISYPNLVGAGSPLANPRGMFAGGAGTGMFNSVGIFTSNGSGLSFGTSNSAGFPGMNVQKRSSTGPQISLKLKF